MRIAIYARVSKKDGQETDNQVVVLSDFAQRHGWTIIETYIDKESGGTGDRVQFQALFTDAERGRFDLVLFWALDRFSREGVLETLKHLDRLTRAGVGWKSYTEQYLDSAGIFKEAIISIMATLAKQERVKISERTKAGLATARLKGKSLGRPRLILDRDNLLRRQLAGASLSELAAEFRISRTQVARIIKKSKQPLR